MLGADTLGADALGADALGAAKDAGEGGGFLAALVLATPTTGPSGTESAGGLSGCSFTTSVLACVAFSGDALGMELDVACARPSVCPPVSSSTPVTSRRPTAPPSATALLRIGDIGLRERL